MMHPAKPQGPTLEHELMRAPELGYEPPVGTGFVRSIEHGTPFRLERWHYHDEYELQLIVKTRGKAFVGDFIGHYEPGHLCLTGPRLPHNWVAEDLPEGGVSHRNLVIHFRDAPLRAGMEAFPELCEVLPLLERARRGVEFFGISAQAEQHFRCIRNSIGLARFAEFANLLTLLTRCADFRLLSSAPLQSNEDAASLAKLDKIMKHVDQHLAESIAVADVCSLVGMTQTTFSHYFRRVAGNTFTDFVNQMRIDKACGLLMETDKYISIVAYEVGFNNLANFNRRFLRAKGMTPKEFRRLSMERFGANS